MSCSRVATWSSAPPASWTAEKTRETASNQMGGAAPQMSVTDTAVAGWTKIIRNATTMAWIPSRDVVPYRPLVADHPTGCVVTGIRASDGMVMFSHPDL